MKVKIQSPIKSVDILMEDITISDVSDLIDALSKNLGSTAVRTLYESLTRARTMLTGAERFTTASYGITIDN